MSDNTGLMSFDDDKNSIKPYSKKMAALYDDEVRRIVAKAHQFTEKVVNEHKEKLELVCISDTCYRDGIQQLGNLGIPAARGKPVISQTFLNITVKMEYKSRNALTS